MSQADSSRSTRRIGGVMFGLMWLILLGLGASYFSGWLDRQNNPNTNPASRGIGGVVQIELAPNRAGHYVASGTVNGASVEFMLDTGATTVAIPGPLADRIGLQRGREIITSTANGNAIGFVTTLDSVQLGAIVLRRIPAIILPGFKDGEILLGMTFLEQLDWQQKDGQLLLSTR